MLWSPWVAARPLRPDIEAVPCAAASAAGSASRQAPAIVGSVDAAERVHEWRQRVHQRLVADMRAAHAHDHIACLGQGSAESHLVGTGILARCRGAAAEHPADGQEGRSPERPRGTTRGVTEGIAGRDEGRGSGGAGPRCGGGRDEAAHHAHAVVAITRDGIEPTELCFRAADGHRRGVERGDHGPCAAGDASATAAGVAATTGPGVSGATVHVPPPVR